MLFRETVAVYCENHTEHTNTLKQTNSVVLVRKRIIPTERPPHVGEVSTTFADRGCRVVSATDLHGRILGFLDRTNTIYGQKT
jgi:hypothetical protein